MNKENSPRDIRGIDFPWDATLETKLKFVVNYAALAPSTHNTQPWLFRITDRSVEIFADRSRALAVVDPDDRALTISCGAATGNLCAALDAVGLDHSLHVFPNIAEPDLVTRITLKPERDQDSDWLIKLDAIHKRKTVRAGFRDKPLPVDYLIESAAGVSTEHAVMCVNCDPECEFEVLAAVQQADSIWSADKHFMRENASWMHPLRKRSRDGVPARSTKLPSSKELWSAPMQFLGSGERRTLTGAVLTDRDAPMDWANSGIVLSNMLNKVAGRGIGAALMSHPLFLAPTHLLIKESLKTESIPQILVRFGYPERSPATPRRPLVDVMLHPGFGR
jgi:nitroreductase